MVGDPETTCGTQSINMVSSFFMLKEILDLNAEATIAGFQMKSDNSNIQKINVRNYMGVVGKDGIQYGVPILVVIQREESIQNNKNVLVDIDEIESTDNLGCMCMDTMHGKSPCGPTENVGN
ncbi:hypothetical protein Hanom_Chr04g00293141 [Helianthus anomalus]